MMKKETIEKLESLAAKYGDMLKFFEKDTYAQSRAINNTFLEACHYGDYDTAYFLTYNSDLPTQASIYGYDTEGFTKACYAGSLEIVKMYMEYETEIENKQFAFRVHNNQALKYACQRNHLHILKYFETIKSQELPIEYNGNVMTTLNLDNNKETLNYILYETDYQVDNYTYNVFKNIFKMTEMIEIFDQHKLYIAKKQFKESLEHSLEDNSNVEHKTRCKL